MAERRDRYAVHAAQVGRDLGLEPYVLARFEHVRDAAVRVRTVDPGELGHVALGSPPPFGVVDGAAERDRRCLGEGEAGDRPSSRRPPAGSPGRAPG